MKFWQFHLQGLTHLFLGQVHLQALLDVVLHLLNVAGGDLLPVCRSRRFRHRPLCMAEPCSKGSFIILNWIVLNARIPPNTPHSGRCTTRMLLVEVGVLNCDISGGFFCKVSADHTHKQRLSSEFYLVNARGSPQEEKCQPFGYQGCLSVLVVCSNPG